MAAVAGTVCAMVRRDNVVGLCHDALPYQNDRASSVKYPSQRELELHIRASAQDSANVAWTNHADVQMRRRKLNRGMALEALRHGRLIQPPEPHVRHPGVSCRVERFVAGVQVAVVVSVEFPAPDLVVITVIDVNGA